MTTDDIHRFDELVTQADYRDAAILIDVDADTVQQSIEQLFR